MFKTSFSLLILFVSLFALSISVNAKNNHKDKPLPPGLQKKQQQGKPLPPGWQKKLHKGHILDVNVYHHAKIVIPVNSHGVITVTIDGRLLKLDKISRKILDILN